MNKDSRLEVAEERDPVQLNCTTSSSCRRSCFQIFIIVQLAIIFALSLCLKSLSSSAKYERYGGEDDEIDNSYFSNSVLNRSSWVGLDIREKMERLNENPVYAEFNITKRNDKPRLNLLLIVSSAPKRGDRRTAIRETWWQDCNHATIKVKCIFMTDITNNQTLLDERDTHKDIEFQVLKGGVEFGKRFLYHMLWAVQNYNFDYFMRLDDDYFFCLRRFLNELILPPPKHYHWGFVHCQENIVRPEESIIMFSRDLTEAFLGQDPGKMLCHPWADQMIALWVQELDFKKLYNHDKRLHHDPPVSHIPNFVKDLTYVCRQYIGLHGSYPDTTRELWAKYKKQTSVDLDVELDEFTIKCRKKQAFDWNAFIDEWRYKPKLCVKDPQWDTYFQEKGKGVYVGRQGV
eukprot:gene20488-22504_t